MAKPRKSVTQTHPPPKQGAQVDKQVFAFPNRSRCPRCGRTDTECYGRADDIEYRRCTSGTCRKRYKVQGQRI